MAKGRLKGGNSSSGPHTIDPKHDSMTRTRRRSEAQKNAKDHVRVKFGGYQDRGGNFWPEGMRRAAARRVAFSMARRFWREGIDVSKGPVVKK
jgi:hypothetical protein